MERTRQEKRGAVTYAVRGSKGAVSLTLFPDGNQDNVAGPVSLHYPMDQPAGLHPEECEFLPDGSCQPDVSYRAGKDLYEDFRTAGRDDEVIYTELEAWYTDRMGGQL